MRAQPGAWLPVAALVCLLCFNPALAAPPPPAPTDGGSCGVVNPPAYYQRYRRAEYPADAPFFQWWYFWLHNERTHEHFYFSYGMLDCPGGGDPAAPGVWASFGVVNGSAAAAATLQREEHWPNATLAVGGYYDLRVTPPGEGPAFALTALSDDAYAAAGRMNHTAQQAVNMGVAPGTVLAWNVSITRVWGWYGESGDWEAIGRTLGRGALSWNTYAHGSLVTGTVAIGDVTYNLDPALGWRAYCDMNWGERFLNDFDDKPALTYGWSWMKVGIPQDTLPGVPEVSIIAGYGLDGFGFPAGVVMGAFADVRFGPLPGASGASGSNVSGALEAREVGVWWNSKWQHVALDGTSDGHLHAFNVTRGAWANFTDATGSYPIPLAATLAIESDTYLVAINFTSSVEQYNRADFEALGVAASVAVSTRASPSAPFAPLLAFTSVDAGLEYGYRGGAL